LKGGREIEDEAIRKN
jgi:hypothetical protein